MKPRVQTCSWFFQIASNHCLNHEEPFTLQQRQVSKLEKSDMKIRVKLSEHGLRRASGSTPSRVTSAMQKLLHMPASHATQPVLPNDESKMKPRVQTCSWFSQMS